MVYFTLNQLPFILFVAIMKKYIVFALTITFIFCLFGCGRQEQQGDNNMQYFFSGKVIAVDEAYLVLEVFDTGNSTLSEGVKVEVSTEIVAAKGCPAFNVDDMQEYYWHEIQRIIRRDD